MRACETDTGAQSVGGWGCHRPAEERGQYRPAEWEVLLQSVGGRGFHRPAEERGQYRPAEWGAAVNLEAVSGRGCCSRWVRGQYRPAEGGAGTVRWWVGGAASFLKVCNI